MLQFEGVEGQVFSSTLFVRWFSSSLIKPISAGESRHLLFDLSPNIYKSNIETVQQSSKSNRVVEVSNHVDHVVFNMF